MRFRPTIRVRLTAWYAAWLLISGVVLLGIAYLALGRSLSDYDREVARNFSERIRPQLERDFPGEPPRTPPIGTPRLGGPEGELLEQARADARAEERRQLALELAGASLVLLLMSIGGGWLIAGRALRPVADITAASKRVTAGHLGERIGLRSPRDELKELADSFDEMLARLESASHERRRFVDNASHELRTPLAMMRGALESTLEDDDATERELREMAATITKALARSEQLVTGLLTLSRSEHYLAEPVSVDLAELAEATLHDYRALLERSDITSELRLQPAVVDGDPFLLERMIGNLVENAIKYNQRGGHLSVETCKADHRSVLEIENTGERVSADDVAHLFEPFFRLDDSRSRSSGGAGLGLAIVERVARAHDGTVRASARVEGGLCIRVDLPATSIEETLAEARVGESAQPRLPQSNRRLKVKRNGRSSPSSVSKSSR